MDDPPKAHRCVEAGKMPALPGGRSDTLDMSARAAGSAGDCMTNTDSAAMAMSCTFHRPHSRRAPK